MRCLFPVDNADRQQEIYWQLIIITLSKVVIPSRIGCRAEIPNGSIVILYRDIDDNRKHRSWLYKLQATGFGYSAFATLLR